jgi:hypothetical protein
MSEQESGNAFLWIIAVIVGMFIVFALGEALTGSDQPNNEPYTGVCLEPTPQLGC